MVGAIVDGSDLFLIGIDPATGRELWRQQMAYSLVTPGDPVPITPVGDHSVAYLRPRPDRNNASNSRYAQLVVGDARSGEDRATSPSALFDSWPYACMNGVDACAISHGNPGGREHQYRLVVDGDDYVAESESIMPGARLLAPPGLLDLGDRPDNTLAWLRNGKLAWSVPVAAAFPAGFSSDYGWEWYRFTAQGVVVGSVFGEPSGSGGTAVFDLERGSATAGLSEETGAVLWRDRGSSFQCHLADREHAVRCRSHGTEKAPSGTAVYEGLDVTVEGFDVMTGQTTWSIAMGPAEVLVSSRQSLPVAGPAQVVVNRPSGPVVLDYGTGRAIVPAPGATYWCLTRVRYHTYPSYTASDGTRQTDRPGGELATICDEQGRAATALPGEAATVAAGARVGNYAVIAGRNGYVGFRIR